MTCDHPAWSLRAARGVWRDPLRFLAARGRTRRCARHDTHAASSIVISIISSKPQLRLPNLEYITATHRRWLDDARAVEIGAMAAACIFHRHLASIIANDCMATRDAAIADQHDLALLTATDDQFSAAERVGARLRRSRNDRQRPPGAGWRRLSRGNRWSGLIRLWR